MYTRSINTTKASMKKPQREDLIIFGDEDMKGVGYPHLNAIMTTINIWGGGIKIRRFHVDNGSSWDILSLNAFNKIGIN